MVRLFIRKRWILIIIGTMFLLSACNYNRPEGLTNVGENLVDSSTRFSSVSFDYFDTVSQIIGYAKSQEEFDEFIEIVYSELERMHKLFDIFHEYPGLNNLYTINKNAGIAPVEVDPLLIELIQASKEAYELTYGTVNIALGPVLRIWHGKRQEEVPKIPTMEVLLEANTYTNIKDIVVDSENNTVFLLYEKMSLDVGGIAKGFALEVVATRARETGMTSFLINIGGDVYTGNPPPGRDFWKVAVESPRGENDFIDVVLVWNRSVLASGDYRRYFVVDDTSYSHLIDPITLMPANHFSTVAVLHPSPLLAEILSTAIFILDLDSGQALLKEHGGEAVWFTYDDQIITTDGFSQFIAEP